LAWAAADMRCRGFLVGGTAGRTTLAGEGLQHQDGHSHHLAQVIPACVAYDPAYAYEIAVILRSGLDRMVRRGDDVFYYLTVGNESYAMPAAVEGCEEGIVRGMYCLRRVEGRDGRRVRLLGSGAILNEVLRAADLLAERFDVCAEVWSVTSYSELRRDALACERRALLDPARTPDVPYIRQCLESGSGPVVAASDYMRSLPDGLARWIPGRLTSLGTDGYGRSDSRKALREFFEVDSRYVALAALAALAEDGDEAAKADVVRARDELGIRPDKPNPLE
jgi:pyruvate dehydrogenase E1 component